MMNFGSWDVTTLCNCGQKVRIPSRMSRVEIVMNSLRKMIFLEFLGQDMNAKKYLRFMKAHKSSAAILRLSSLVELGCGYNTKELPMVDKICSE